MLKTKKVKVHIDFVDEVLGTTPTDKNILQTYITSKAPKPEDAEEELANVVAEEPKKTVFPRNAAGEPIIYDYQIKGFFKDCCGSLNRLKGVSESSKIKAYKKVIDGLIFVTPREIAINLNGNEIGTCERPLRAMTPQGERIALAASESIPEGASCDFVVELYDAEHENLLREWLDYGIHRGFGQWRNSGKGRFVYELG